MCKETQIKKFFVLVAVLFVFSHQQSILFAQNPLPILELNKSVEKEIEAGTSNTYEINVDAEQYLFVLVEFQGTDLDVKLYNSEGGLLYDAGNLSGGSRVKTVYAVSDRAGKYRLEIVGRKDSRPKGKYRVTIKDQRSATEKDKFSVSAEKVFAQGELLQSKRSRESLQSAIKKYEEAAKLFELANSPARKGAAMTNLGQAYYLSGKTQQALASFQEVLKISRETNDQNTEAQALNNLGSISSRVGDFQSAIKYFTQSLKLVKELNIVLGEGSILINLASIYKVKAEYEKALDYANQSLALFRKIDKKDSIANSLNTLGSIYDDMGEPQKALSFYQQSLKEFQQAKLVRRQAVVLNNIGTVYSKFGDKQRALDSYLKVLTIVRESGNKIGESRTLGNLGTIYSSLGEREKALKYLQEALILSRQSKNRLNESSILMNIGVTHYRLGDFDKALKTYQEALKIAQEIEAKYQQALIFDRLGEVYFAYKNEEKALENYSRSLSVWRNIGDTYQQSETLFRLADIDTKNNAFERAEEKMSLAISLKENYRAKVSSQELRTSYFSVSQNLYTFYINLLMRLHEQSPQKGFDIKAFKVSEQARARSMVETLAESHIKIREGVDIQLLKREQQIQKQLNKKESDRIRLANRKGGGAKLQATKDDINQLLNEYKDIKTQIRNNSPQYAELIEPKSLEAHDVQELLDPDTVVLEYSLGENGSYVWAVKSDSVSSYTLPKSAEIDKSAKEVQKLLTSRNTLPEDETADQTQARIEKTDTELAASIQKLSKTIILPLAKELDKKRIIIVADSYLRYIPFGVLTKASQDIKAIYKPLILEHEVINLPSASTLSSIRDRTSKKKTIPGSVAVIADPVFNESDPRVAQSIAKLKNVELNAGPNEKITGELKRSVDDFSINQFRRLRFSRREANDIASLASANRSFKAVDFDADRDLFFGENLSKYQILHFATHGLLNNKNPELSGIVLSLVDKRGNSKDGFLRLHDIYNMNIGAELVVLSACQTALGKDIQGEGLIGLTRGFMYAGAESVVASLWKVEDRATAELMKKFYRAMLKDGQRPAAALRTAQVEMSKDKRWSNPYYWAAFTLQGEWQ